MAECYTPTDAGGSPPRIRAAALPACDRVLVAIARRAAIAPRRPCVSTSTSSASTATRSCFFRMGDFYEMFYEDALTASRVLELTLTSRAKDAHGARDPDVRRAVSRARHLPRAARPQGLSRRDLRSGRGRAQGQGHRQARGHARRLAGHVHRRGVSRRARAGVSGGGRAGAHRRDGWGLAFLDVSTGEFAAAEFARRRGTRRHRWPPSSPCCGRRSCSPPTAPRSTRSAISDGARLTRVTRIDGWTFDPAARATSLCEQLRRASLAGYGLEHAPAAIAAAGAIVSLPARHAAHRARARPRHLAAPDATMRCSIDPVTLRHLNVIEGVDGGRAGSLLDDIDRTVTAMGGRLLRQWLVRPLVTLARIQDRLDAVEDFAFRTTERGKLREVLGGMHDLERLVARDLARHRRDRATWPRSASRWRPLPRLRTRWPRSAGAARHAASSPRSTTRGRPRRDRGDARRRAAGASRATAA